MSKKVLIVDNDFFFIEFLSELLEKRGYQVIKAHDGKEGISILKKESVDYLFLEIILPKIDGKQLIKFARRKFSEDCFPIIAVSGYLVEQMDELNGIGADYYIAKGHMENMGEHVEAFLDVLENASLSETDNIDAFIEPGQIFPRQTTVQLMDILNFQKAITESAGIGILVVDTDGKIIHANVSSLEIVKKSLADVLGCAITSIFPIEEKEKMVNALKRALRDEGPRRSVFLIHMKDRQIRTNVSLLEVNAKKSGWVISIEDTTE